VRLAKYQRKKLLVAAALATFALMALPSSAQVPSAQFAGQVQTYADVSGTGWETQTTSSPGSIGASLGGAVSDSAVSRLSIQTNPMPAVYASGQISSPPVNGYLPDVSIGDGKSDFYGPQITYSIEFFGPTSTVPVLVNASVGSMTSALPTGYASLLGQANFSVTDPSGFVAMSDGVSLNSNTVGGGGSATSLVVQNALSVSNSTVTFSSGSGYDALINDAHIWNAQTGVLYTVALAANVQMSLSGLLGGGTLSATSYADPTFQIASGYTGYSIALSSGIGNLAPVPEPSTYALMVAGLGLLGVVARRRNAS
jgi:hypothetical protein